MKTLRILLIGIVICCFVMAMLNLKKPHDEVAFWMLLAIFNYITLVGGIIRDKIDKER